VLGDLERHPFRQPPDRPLELGVLERDHLAAGVADHVMVMAFPAGRLEAGQALADLDARDQAQLLELLEDPVDAGPRDAAAATVAQRLLDLGRRQRAALLVEQRDQRRAGPAAPVARAGQRLRGALAPAVVGRMPVLVVGGGTHSHQG